MLKVTQCDFVHGLSCAQVSKRITELEEQNDRLRAERNHLLLNMNPTACELRRVRAAWADDRGKNEKLQNLVRDMWTCISENECGDCSYCSRYSDCVEGISEFEHRMEDLGIEVPEWKRPKDRDRTLYAESAELRKLVCALYLNYHDEWPDRAEEVFLPALRELGIVARDG